MRIYAEEELPLEHLWATRDIDGIFASIKTLYRYHRNLIHQIDDILKTLCKELTIAKGSAILPDMLPGEQTPWHKIRLMFTLLDILIDTLHQKHRSGIILVEELHSFLHAYLFKRGGIVFLDSS